MAMIICGADNPLKDEGDFEEKSGYFTQKKKWNAFVQVATTMPSNIQLPASAMVTNHR